MKPYLPNLASRDLGAGVVAANDELFAARENLILPRPAEFTPHTFGPKGQIMDGWETRRRREPTPDSADWAIVRLGMPGVIRHVVVDTAFFRGNYPPEISFEACAVDGHPSPEQLAAAEWTTLIARTRIGGDAEHPFDVEDPHRWTHVRLSIYPDGGVARLRVFGDAVADPRLLTDTVDLTSLENGGHVLDCSNAFYSSPNNLLKPGVNPVMGDGWETARRRDTGNDWVEFGLGCAGTILVAEIDTSHFVGNAPGSASLRAGDAELLPRTPLQPDTRHRFRLPAVTPVERVRLDIFPDGGMGRVRLWGQPTATGRAQLARRFVDALPAAHLAAVRSTAGLDDGASAHDLAELLGTGP